MAPPVSRAHHGSQAAHPRAMRPGDRPAAALLLAPVMGWWPLLVESTFGLGEAVVSEVVADGDRLVGVVHLVRAMPGLPDDMFHLRMVVDESGRGRGIGGMMWRRVLDALPPGATVTGRSPADDTRALAVTSRWGFEPAGATLYQRRDLSGQMLPAPRAVPGVSLEIARGRLAGALYDRVASVMAAGSALDVSIATYADPQGTTGAFSTEPTMSIIAAQPGELVAVFAVAGKLDVGFSIAIEQESGWHIADTAVIPAWRRRGVASWIKAELTRLADRDGARWLTTHNDDENAPILALNGASGYSVIRRIVALRRPP